MLKLLTLLVSTFTCSGCITLAADLAINAAASRYHRANVQDKDIRIIRTRDYQDCIAKDNTTWAVIDACMEGKGYTHE